MRPSLRPAASRAPAGSAATRVTSALSSKPISIACLPIGPSAPANGQTTTPLAPAVASMRAALEEGQAAHLGRIAAHAHVLGVGEPPAVQRVLLHRRHQEAAVGAEARRRCASRPSAASPAAARRSARTRAPRRRRSRPPGAGRARRSATSATERSWVKTRQKAGSATSITRASRPAREGDRGWRRAAPPRSRSSGPSPRPAAASPSRRDQTRRPSSPPVITPSAVGWRTAASTAPSCGVCARAVLPSAPGRRRARTRPRRPRRTGRR